MDTTQKLHPGQMFQPEIFKRVDGADYTFGTPGKWQALFVFRGQHCPICMGYLTKIEERREAFATLGIAIAAVSADTETQTRKTIAASRPSFPMLYGMDVPTMQRLGLYISEPRSTQEADHRFPEPGLLCVNDAGVLQIIEVTNGAFLRPDLDRLLMGLGFMIEKNYPARGAYR